MKICKRCEIEKDSSEYYKQKHSHDGYENNCKLCRNLSTKLFRENDSSYHERHNIQAKKYRDNNKEKVKESKIQYYLNNKEIINEYIKEYYSIEINKKRKISSNYRRRKQRVQSYPLYSFSISIREMIRNSFKRTGLIKESKTSEIIGCSFEEFKIYSESKFEPWMSWENKGLYNGELNYGWDIDHIMPISLAKNTSELIKLNHYTNLQPLCSRVNRDIKRNNTTWERI